MVLPGDVHLGIALDREHGPGLPHRPLLPVHLDHRVAGGGELVPDTRDVHRRNAGVEHQRSGVSAVRAVGPEVAAEFVGHSFAHGILESDAVLDGIAPGEADLVIRRFVVQCRRQSEPNEHLARNVVGHGHEVGALGMLGAGSLLALRILGLPAAPSDGLRDCRAGNHDLLGHLPVLSEGFPSNEIKLR